MGRTGPACGYRRCRRALAGAAAAVLWGCGSDGAGERAAPPAVVEHACPEDDLATVRLSAQAEARLGIDTVVLARDAVSRTRTVGGEIMAAPGHEVIVAAPVAGTVLGPAGGTAPMAGARVGRGQTVFRLVVLVSDRSLASAEQERQAAMARASQLRTRSDRARQLLAQPLISVQDEEMPALYLRFGWPPDRETT